MTEFKSILSKAFSTSVTVLLLLMFFGSINEMLNDISFYSSFSGFFFVSGFLFALLNLLNKKSAKLKEL